MVKSPETRTSLVSLTSMAMKAKKLDMDTGDRLIAITRGDCAFCRSAGLRSEARVNLKSEEKTIIATLYTVNSPIVNINEVGLSDRAWEKLGINEGEKVIVTLAEPLDSFGFVRAKLHGIPFKEQGFKTIMNDMVAGRYSDVQLSAFITACVDLNLDETISLTKEMSETGHQVKWPSYPILDKHCVGGLPGNRTTMILVPIVAAYGFTIPKTSSRAITSPAGTADTMEVIAPVNLSIEQMKGVVEKEGGCIIWGGSVDLSPVDDILLRVERALDLDSPSQLIASVLSKKIAVGSTHVLIDMPVGLTAKIRTSDEAALLRELFHEVSRAFGLHLRILETDGLQPIGHGIGPALEARDVLAVLRGEKTAPQDLKEKALLLSGALLEFCADLENGQGYQEAKKILEDGRAFKKFEAICRAQGGFSEPKFGRFKHVIVSNQEGMVIKIDNRLISRVAKLAGAPDNPSAGVDLHISVGAFVSKGEPLFTIYAESEGELNYALHYFYSHQDVVVIGESL